MKTKVFRLAAALFVAFTAFGFTACSDDDDSRVGVSDEKIVQMLQGTWDVAAADDEFGVDYEVWVFSGNQIRAWGETSTFTVKDGVIYADALDYGAVVLTKINANTFGAYWHNDPTETYVGVKRQ
ncbi:MAG: hypothetical protein J6M53_08640 [Bacteroidaceae bacterium]|nr:hypothetical protein [Bacteroidaceae bacterium]